MTKTLIISWLYPWPKYVGGSSRTLNFCQFFKENGSVDLVYSYKDYNAEKYKFLFRNEYFLKRDEYPLGAFDRIAMLSKGIPYPLSTYKKGEQKKLIKIIEENDYDFIIARYIKSVPGINQISKKYIQRTIIDLDDILSGSLYETFFDANLGLLKRFKRSFNKIVLKKYENNCRKFGVCLLCSNFEKKIVFGERKFHNVFVVPNIFSDNTFNEYKFGDGTKNRNNLIFIGSLCYPPNIEGLKWFVKEIFPEARKNFKDIKLSIVGHEPNEEIQTLCKTTDGIDLFPNVPDVKEYYKKSNAIIVPILNGGGTRIKILEGALAERVIFSTSKGAEGLELKDKRDILIFNSSKEFCDKYKLVMDDNVYREICKNAKTSVQMAYSWINFRQNMNMVVKKIKNSQYS
jgi:hypothetical protein